MDNKFDISEFVNVRTQESVRKDLVDRFVKRRKEAGYTQNKLSHVSGVSYASIRRFETNGEISLTSLLKLADALDILNDFDELFKNSIIKSIRPEDEKRNK